MQILLRRTYIVQAIILAIFIYFCFEYKPIEHRLYHGIYKVAHTFINIPQKLSQDYLFYLSDLFIFLAFLLVFAKKGFQKIALFSKPENGFLTLLVFITFLSVIFSPYEKDYSRLIRVNQLFFALLFFITISKISTEKLIRMVFFIIVGIALIQTFCALYQYFTQGALGISRLGEVKFFKYPQSLAKVPSYEGKIWIFDLFKVDKRGLFRAYGTMDHPNILGCFLFTSILCSLYFWMRVKGAMRLFLSLFIFFQQMALIVTFSRSGLYACILSTLIFFYFAKSHLFKKRIMYFSVFSAFLIGNIFLFYPVLYKRGSLQVHSGFSKASNIARMHHNKIALQMIRKHPLKGIGYDQYMQHVKEFIPEDKSQSEHIGTIHNIYLLMGAETGLLGLFCFLAFIYCVMKKNYRPKDDMQAALLCIFLGYLLIGLVDYYFLFFQQGKILFFGIAGQLVAYSRYVMSSKVDQSEGCSSILYSEELSTKC